MAGKITTVIAVGTRINGQIESDDDIEVLGQVQGSVKTEGDLRIAEEARIDANVEVSRLEIRGIFVGNATASESIELFSAARVVGDLSAPRVVMHDGAAMRGLIDMGDPEGLEQEEEAPAPRKRTPARRASTRRPARRRAAPKTVEEEPAPPAEPEQNDDEE